MKLWHLLIPGAILVAIGSASAGSSSSSSSSSAMARALERWERERARAASALDAIAGKWGADRLDAAAYLRANGEDLLEATRTVEEAKLAGDVDLVERMADRAHSIGVNAERAIRAMTGR